MIEPSDVDLNSCPEVVQQYVKHLEAEASEKFCICPIMSRVPSWHPGLEKIDHSDLIEIKCQGKDCALWVVEISNRVLSEGQKPTEHCGLIK